MLKAVLVAMTALALCACQTMKDEDTEQGGGENVPTSGGGRGN